MWGNKLGNYIGEFLEYNDSNNSSCWKNYKRTKVKIDVRLPLKRRKNISCKGGSGSIVSFKHERLPNLCFICGLLGHTKFFCPKLADPPKDQIRKEWDSWLRVQNLRCGFFEASGDGRAGGVGECQNMEIVNSGGNGQNGKWKNIVGVKNFSLVIESSNSGTINEKDSGILLDSNEERKRMCGPGGDKAHTNEMELDNLTTEKEGNQVAITVGDHPSHFFIDGFRLSGPSEAMKILSWNCWGLSNFREVLALGELVQTHKPYVIFLSETLSHVNELEDLKWKVGYECCFAVDKEGRSRGLGFFLEGFYLQLYYFLF